MATKKQGVGIWEHYRTNETPKADGLEYRGEIDGAHVHAKLYWAPADFRNPNAREKRPYLVVMFSETGERDMWGSWVDELRNSDYVGEERPRRNWNELCTIAEKIDESELAGYMADARLYHAAMLHAGCTYENKVYYHPQGSTPEEVRRKALAYWNEHKEVA